MATSGNASTAHVKLAWLNFSVGQFKAQLTRCEKFIAEQREQVLLDDEGLRVRMEELQRSYATCKENILEMEMEGVHVDDDTIEDRHDITKFTPFIDIFTAVVGDNTSLSAVQKLFYLKKYLKSNGITFFLNVGQEPTKCCKKCMFYHHHQH